MPAAGDVEDQGVDNNPQLDDALPAAGTLVEGVTPEGDTVLHAVASNGVGDDFLKCADIICGRDMNLLFANAVCLLTLIV